MRQFFNPELLAPNALTIPVNAEIVGECDAFVTDRDSLGLTVVKPDWHSDIEWVSPKTVAGYERFESIFRRLDVAGHVAGYLDLEREVQLYSGFLVVRSACEEPDFHLDWVGTNNEAFTLITPVTSNAAGFGLLYRKLNGSVGEYEYRSGEAIVFGDHFSHSTKPGKSEEPVVLLSFTFGTDKMEHWPKIERTAGYQGRLVRRPDGQFQTR